MGAAGEAGEGWGERDGCQSVAYGYRAGAKREAALLTNEATASNGTSYLW